MSHGHWTKGYPSTGGSPRCGVRCVVVSIPGVKYNSARDVKQLMKEFDDVRKASVVEQNTPGP